VQINDSSKVKIMGLLNKARLAEEASVTFSEEFTMDDNSVVTLNSAKVRQLAMASAQYVSDVYARARELREAIFAHGITDEELASIDINSGWPD
jgi:hypothetical protein